MLGIWDSLFIEANGASGGLGIIWNPKKVDLLPLKNSSNWMCVRVQSLKSDLNFILINVYARNSPLGKKVVWNELSSVFLNSKESLIIMGGGGF